jgi:DNA-binding response OmpR family regulator
MRTILLIDDNIEILENFKEYFELEGYKVLTSNNGNIGIALALEFIPDLIICDILMPGMDGYEVLHRLSKSAKTCEIPFIFSSSKSEKTDRMYALKLGVDNYIVKPFDPKDLLKMADTCFKSLSKRILQS